MNSRYWARTALVAAVGFLILLAVLHFLEPEFDPSKRLISEYELGRYGWLMSLAFFALGVGVLAMLLSTRNVSMNSRCRVGRGCFLAIAAALVGAGIFYPYPDRNLASYVHGLCGLIVIVAFPIAAALCSPGLASSPPWNASPRGLRWATVLVWLGLLSFAASLVVLSILSQPVNRSDPALPVGWQNRAMIVTYSLWLIVIAWPVAFARKERSEGVGGRLRRDR